MYSCKYTWIVIRIPLTRYKMKSISTIIAMSLNKYEEINLDLKEWF